MLSLACCVFATNASAADSATAEALFEKGVAEMQAGRFEAACPAIEESQRIDPRPGALFTLAECYAQWGKVATASARYQEYVDLVSQLTVEQQQRHRTRVEIARAQLAKLRPLVPTLKLVLAKGAPAGTSVARNGQVLSSTALGMPLPVDPGDYTIITRVPNAPDREVRASLQLGENTTIELEAQPPAGVVSAPVPASGSEASPQLEPTPPATTELGHESARKTGAYWVGGVGVAGIVVGSVTGLLAIGKKSKVNDGCSNGVCNQSGYDAANSGKSLATVSDISFGLGLAALGASAVLLLTGDSDRPAEHARSSRLKPSLVAGPGGFIAGLSHAF